MSVGRDYCGSVAVMRDTKEEVEKCEKEEADVGGWI